MTIRTDLEANSSAAFTTSFTTSLTTPFTTAASTSHYAPDLRLAPVHITMRLQVDLKKRVLDAELTHRIRCNSEGARTLVLNAVEFQNVEVATSAVTPVYDGETLTLTWETPFALGEEREVSLSYHVDEPKSGLLFSGGLDDTDHPDGPDHTDHTDLDQPWFAVTDHETERARYWLATVDLPSIRPTLDITLETDARFVSLANGRKVLDETFQSDAGDQRRTRWVLEQPCPSYLTCFAIGDFVSWEDETSELPIAAFAPPSSGTAEDLKRSFGRTKELIQWMEAKLDDPLPYPKYYQFAVPFVGGAMENISLVSWDDQAVLSESLAPEWQERVDIVNLHELAHSWFGDHIVCRDYAHAWLKESWATYMEGCWLESVRGAEAAQYHRLMGADRYFTECRTRYVRPIVTRRFDSSWDMYDMHLYPGGAWRLHMLRAMIGDDVFWTATRAYVAKFGGETVETVDYQRTLEEYSGRSLAQFFEEWLYANGYPKLTVKFHYDAESAEGVFEILQTQVDKKKGIGLFAFDLELAWWHGESETRRSVQVTKNKNSTFRFAMASNPSWVCVDPEHDLLHEITPKFGSAKLRTMLQKGDAVTRIYAGRALCKTGSQADLDAVAAAYRTDAFWGVRQELAAALSHVNTDHAVQTLASLCETHNESRTLESLFSAAGARRDSRIADVLRRRLDGDLPPRARGAAFEALGRQHQSEDIPRLVRGGQEGHRVTQRGAMLGLGQLACADALAPLLDAVQVGARRSFTRIAAATALGELVPRLPEALRLQAQEMLCDLLRDPIPRVRSAAAAALVDSKARHTLAQLASYKLTLPVQDQHRLERGLRKLRSSPSSTSSRSASRVGELEEQLRQLTGRLAKLERRSS